MPPTSTEKPGSSSNPKMPIFSLRKFDYSIQLLFQSKVANSQTIPLATTLSLFNMGKSKPRQEIREYLTLSTAVVETIR
jgi:hypothetical protein